MTSRRYINPAQGGQPASIVVDSPRIGSNNASIVFPWGNPNMIVPPAPANGNPFPPYYRPTTSLAPSSPAVLESAGIPFGLVVNPAQVSNVPVLDYSNTKFPRCSKCASYLSPYTEITPDGKQFHCPLCSSKSIIQTDSYDVSPFRQRTEINYPVYDIIAPRRYYSMPGACAAFMFVVDLSFKAISTGFTSQFLISLKASIANIPDETLFVLCTMSDVISVFDFETNSEKIFSDLSDIPSTFPFPKPIAEYREALCLAIDSLFSRPPRDNATGHCYGSVLEIAEKILAKIGGMVVIGCYDIPTIGPHAFKPRASTQKSTEYDFIQFPKDDSVKFYRDIAFRLNRGSISVSLFSCSDSTSEIAIIAVPCSLTGGMVKYYGSFTPDVAADLHVSLYTCLTTEYLWNCSIRLRFTEGIKLTRPHGSFSIQNKDLLSFPVLNPNYSVTFELALDQPLTCSKAIFQMAMLWTTSKGVRMIRVFTFSLSTSQNPVAIREAMDEAAIICLMAKRCVHGCLTEGPQKTSQTLQSNTVQSISNRIRFVSYLHLVHSLLYSDLLKSSHPLLVDGRMMTIIATRSMGIIDTVLWLYPRLFALDTNIGPLPLTNESFQQGCVFLAHMSNKIVIRVSYSCPAEYMQGAFNTVSFENLSESFEKLDNPINAQIHYLIEDCWKLSGKYLPVEVIKQGDYKERLFEQLIVDSESNTISGLNKWLSQINYFN